MSSNILLYAAVNFAGMYAKSLVDWGQRKVFLETRKSMTTWERTKFESDRQWELFQSGESFCTCKNWIMTQVTVQVYWCKIYILVPTLMKWERINKNLLYKQLIIKFGFQAGNVWINPLNVPHPYIFKCVYFAMLSKLYLLLPV